MLNGIINMLIGYFSPGRQASGSVWAHVARPIQKEVALTFFPIIEVDQQVPPFVEEEVGLKG